MKRKTYRGAYLMGMLMATTIIASGVSNQSVSASSEVIPNHQIATDQQRQEKTITRTIRFQRPDNGQYEEIKQVVRYQADGQPLTMTEWPEYYLPQFAGYYPDTIYLPAKVITSTDESQTVKVEYKLERQRPAMVTQALTNYFEFYDVSGELVGQLKDRQPYYQQAALPKPPAGYEYVNQETLPEQYRVYFDVTANYRLLVQPLQTKTTTSESKHLSRQVICHLPTGDQVIKQPLTLTRQVTVTSPELNKRVTTPWQVRAEPIELPHVHGYQAASLPDLPSELTAGQAILPVEIDYQPDKIAVDEETQANIQAESQDSQTQTSNQTADQATMTENESHDEATSTDGLATSVDAQTQSETSLTTTGTDTTDLISQRDEATQQKPNGVDTGCGDESVNVNDEGSQTSSLMVDQASGEDSASGATDADTQTDLPPATTETGTATTDLAVTVDQGEQTEKQGVDTASGDGEINLTDQGSQTTVSQQDAATQTVVSTTEVAVGDGVADKQVDDEQTQTIPPEAQDEASQTLNQHVDPLVRPTVDSSTSEPAATSFDSLTPTSDHYQEDLPTRFNNPTPSASASVLASPDLHERLTNLQKSLHDVEDEAAINPHFAKLLPQTGNQADVKLTLLGLLITVGTALLSLFGLSKVITKKK